MTNKSPSEKHAQRLRQLRRWFTTPLGRELRHTEEACLSVWLERLFGHFLVYAGPVRPGQQVLDKCLIKNKVCLDLVGEASAEERAIQGTAEALPLLSDGVDALILQHLLEFSDDPHQVLREAERVLIPEGELIIVGFNPGSLWGLMSLLLRARGRVPWQARNLGVGRLRDWLSLLGFSIEEERYGFYRLPLQHQSLLERMVPMESFMGRWMRRFGSVYAVRAKKQVVILTPMKNRWRRKPSIVSGGRVAEPSAREVVSDK